MNRVLKQNSPFRPEVQALGLTVLVDARICPPSSALTWGLSQLQVSRGLWLPSRLFSIWSRGRAELDFLAGSIPRVCTATAAGWEDARGHARGAPGTEPGWLGWKWDIFAYIFLHHSAFVCRPSSWLLIRASSPTFLTWSCLLH